MGMTVREAILTLNANVVIACERAEFDSVTVKMVEDALDIIEDALQAQEPGGEAHWIPCNGKSHIWYCSHCGEKINYNNAHKVYAKDMKPVEQVNRFCRRCGFLMISRPTDAQREAVAWQ